MIISDSEEDPEIHSKMTRNQGDNSERFVLLVPPATPPKGSEQIYALSEIRQLPIRKIVGILRGKIYSHAMVFCKDMETLKRRSLYTCFITGVRANKRSLVDENGKEVNVSFGTFLCSLGKLVFEALIVPVVLFFSFAVLWSVKFTQRQ